MLGAKDARAIEPFANHVMRLNSQESVAPQAGAGQLFEIGAQNAVSDQNELGGRILFLHFDHRANQEFRAFSIGETADEQNGGFPLALRGRKEFGVHADVMDESLVRGKMLCEKFSTNELRDREK